MAGRSVVAAAVLLLAAACSAPSGSVSGPTGRVDIGGRNLWVECLGEGTPVVVIESGSVVGTAAGTLGIAQGVAERTTVCRYDRAGSGRSDPHPSNEPGIADRAADLAAMLAAAEMPGPYMLVGGAVGAQIVLAYAMASEETVAGLVILDTNLPTTDVARHPLAGLLAPADLEDYYRGAERGQAWLAETEALLHPLPSVAVRVLTATLPDADCPFYWTAPVCEEALERHIAFQSDWLTINPNAVLREIDALPGLADADDAVVADVLALLDQLETAP